MRAMIREQQPATAQQSPPPPKKVLMVLARESEEDRKCCAIRFEAKRETWFNCHWIRQKHLDWVRLRIDELRANITHLRRRGRTVRWHGQAHREAVRIVTNSEYVANTIKAGKAIEFRSIVMDGETATETETVKKCGDVGNVWKLEVGTIGRNIWCRALADGYTKQCERAKETWCAMAGRKIERAMCGWLHRKLVAVDSSSASSWKGIELLPRPWEKVAGRTAIAKYGVTPVDSQWFGTDKACEGGVNAGEGDELLHASSRAEKTQMCLQGHFRLEALKASGKRWESFTMDVSRVCFFRPKGPRPVLVCLPAEDLRNNCSSQTRLSKKSMYGTRDAAGNLECGWQSQLKRWDYTVGQRSKKLVPPQGATSHRGWRTATTSWSQGQHPKLVELSNKLARECPINTKTISHGSTWTHQSIDQKGCAAEQE